MKHTSESHIDHDNLRTALDEIKKTADKINEEKRNYESMEKLQNIQATLKGDFSVGLRSPSLLIASLLLLQVDFS